MKHIHFAEGKSWECEADHPLQQRVSAGRRDLFAATALRVYLEQRNLIPGRERGTIAEVCQAAWMAADEMLNADPENTRRA